MTLSFLEEVAQVTTGREKSYDHPLTNHIRIGLMWAIRRGNDDYTDPISVAHELNLLKEARDAFTPKYDNPLDSAGYMSCIGRMIELYMEMRPQILLKQEAYEELSKLRFNEMWLLWHEADGFLRVKELNTNLNELAEETDEFISRYGTFTGEL